MLYGGRIIIIRRVPPRRIISSHLAFTTLGMLLLILLISTNRILLADAFASNLVNTGIGCMTELSTDEVIMNEEVKPPEQSDFPKMYLAVLDGSDKPINSNNRFRYDPKVPTLNIAFVNPYSSSEFNEDLQFVIEIEGPTEDSRAAEFVSGGLIGCDNNKRVSNNLIDSQASVVLQINDPTATLRIWAGWATGHNAVRLLPDLVLEPGEAGSAAAEKQEDVQPLSREEEEEELEDLEEELREEEFRNTDKEKLMREQQEEKLEKLLNDEPEIPKQQEQIALREETTEEKKVLQRKRKNVLEKPDSVPEGLIDLSKRVKDLGLEIARKDRERGQRGNDASDTKSIQQKLKDKQLDLDASNNNDDNDGQRQKKKHRLTDHTVEHKQRRDIPETINIYDDVTDDDLPEVEAPDVGNDDFLPDEGDIDDADIHAAGTERESSSSSFELQLVLDGSNHFLACVFFAASMTLFLMIFGKKRDKGRRDL